VGTEAGLANAAEQALQGLVAEKVHALLGEPELDLFGGLAGLSVGTEQGLVAGGHLRGIVDLEEPLVDEALDDLVEQFGELALEVLVLDRVAGGLAAEHLEHFGRKLARVHEGLQDGLAEGVHAPVGLTGIVIPEATAAKARLQQEVTQLVEQRLQVDGVGEFGEEFGVGGEAHWAVVSRES